MKALIALLLTLFQPADQLMCEPSGGSEFCCGSCEYASGTWDCGNCAFVISAGCGDVFGCSGSATIPASGDCTITATSNSCCN